MAVDAKCSPNKFCRLILKLNLKTEESEMQTKPLTKAKTSGRAVPATLAKSTPVQPVKAAPSREEIARRAYEIYEARGRADGREVEDWVQAERELQEKVHRNN